MEKLPIGKSFSPEELGNLFVAVEDQPYGNEMLGYRIMIPKGWTADFIQSDSAELNTNQLKPLGIFLSEPPVEGSHAYIQIQAMNLTKSISAANWLRHFCITTEKNLEAIKEISPLFVDSLISFKIDDEPFLARTACRIDRNRIFLLLMFAKEEAYQPLADFFGVAITSFKLLNQNPEAPIENLTSHKGPGNLAVSYPNSWQHVLKEEMPKGKEVLDLYNFDDEKNMNGLIRIKSVEKQIYENSDELVQSVLNEFRESNIVVNDIQQQGDVPLKTDNFSNGKIKIFDTNIASSGIPQELWITTFEDSNNYYGIAMLTPVKENVFYVWAINQRTYQIVLSSIS